MSDRSPRVLRMALRSAVGLTPPTAAAAVRAGISRVEEHPTIVDSEGLPLSCARVPTVPEELEGAARIHALAAQVLADLAKEAEAIGALSVRLLLSTPELRPGWSTQDEARLVDGLSAEGGPLRILSCEVVHRGHAAGLLALGEAARQIRMGDSGACVVLGVDSYLDPATLGWLSRDGRLAQGGARGAMAVGEAAAAILVGSASLARRAGGELGTIVAVGHAQEPHLYSSDHESTADGLCEALGRVLESPEAPVKISDTYLDINGDRYREEQWGFAAVRWGARFEDPLRYNVAAHCWGDIGAATGPALACLAAQAWARNRARGPTAALAAGSDLGLRCVLLLGEPQLALPVQLSEEAPPARAAMVPESAAAAPVQVPATEMLSRVLPTALPNPWDLRPLEVDRNQQPGFTELLDPLEMLGAPATIMVDPMKDEPTATQTVRMGRRKKGRRPGQITLRVLDGPQQGKEESIKKSRIRVGRGEGADFRVDHPSLSNLHFELRIRRDGIDVFDLRSKNGTLLSNRRVFHARVEPGDVLVAGDCAIKLVDAAEIEVDQAEEAREDGLLGISDAMQEAFAGINAAASSTLPTLVCGETGTGKELAARAIHRRSSRRDKPFIALNCATLPVGLAESTILGHRKGAFTGATEDRKGVFEQANGGTLLIDEIGELPHELQAKLLRVLDGGAVTRIGDDQEPRVVDVRIVAATHRDLVTMIDEGEFRQDLYYRLAGLIVEMPSLRDRGGAEIEYLARTFLAERTSEQGPPPSFEADAITALREHEWRGNVRELANVVARAAVMQNGDTIRATDLALRSEPKSALRLEEHARLAAYDEAHDELDRTLLPRILAECGGSLTEAAARLGQSVEALAERLRSLGIVTPPIT